MLATDKPRVEAIISTYNSPQALALCLASVARQEYEELSVCLADDGSGPETKAVFDAFKRQRHIRWRHVWHEDKGFEKCAILNKAIGSSKADIILFLDGDVIIAPDFVSRHVALMRPGVFTTGSLVRLSAQASAKVTQEDVVSGTVFTKEWLKSVARLRSPSDWAKAGFLPPRLADLAERLSPVRKSLCGAHAAVWRRDLLAVNGYDERMKYGGLDKELGERLKAHGLTGRHARYTARLLHLDHPRGYDKPESWAFNRKIIDEVRRTRRDWTAFGIQRHPRAEAHFAATGEHLGVPRLTFPDAEGRLVEETYAAAEAILEYGSGGSTLLAADLGKPAVAVESDPSWAENLREVLARLRPDAQVRVDSFDIGPVGAWGKPVDDSGWRRYPGYAAKVWDTLPEGFSPDVVLIDGRGRVSCFVATLLRTRRDVTVLFDDYTNRPHYSLAGEILAPSRIVGRMAVFHLKPGMTIPDALVTRALSSFTEIAHDV